MSRYDDREELAMKVEWEGGLTEAILGRCRCGCGDCDNGNHCGSFLCQND